VISKFCSILREFVFLEAHIPTDNRLLSKLCEALPPQGPGPPFRFPFFHLPRPPEKRELCFSTTHWIDTLLLFYNILSLFTFFSLTLYLSLRRYTQFLMSLFTFSF
jgi:hypothetical protein